MEAALLAPLVVALLFGIIEAGFFAKAHLTGQELAGDGVRIGSIARDDTDADFQILEAIRRGSAGLRRETVERIVIYEADTLDDAPPAACTSGPLTSSVPDRCSVYGRDDLGLPAGSLTCGWCPPERDEGDLIGLWIRLDYNSVTGMFNNASITDHIVLPIEPDL